jgi:hypothetical protein
MSLDPTESAENMQPDPPIQTWVPDSVGVAPAAEPGVEDTWPGDLSPAKVYVLDHPSRSAFRVIQYSEDAEAEFAIGKFLEFCADTGWSVNQETPPETPPA